MPKYADRVLETTTSTGTGTINLGGAKVDHRAFSAAFVTTDSVYYCIAGNNSNEWEVGFGTLTSGSPWTLSRATVLASSNSGSLVNFSAGTKDVFCTAPATHAFFPTGTRMLFQQTAAPPGWTKDTTAALNDSCIRLVTGTVGSGGATALTTVFGTGKSTDGFTLTSAHIPSHTHPQQSSTIVGTSSVSTGKGGVGAGTTGGTTQATGSGGAHSHTISNLDLKYRDVIVASKD